MKTQLIRLIKKKLLGILIITAISINADAATRTFTGDGSNDNWNNSSNWDNGNIPNSNDDVIIEKGTTPIVNVNTTIASLTFERDNDRITLTINTNITLTVTGNIRLNLPTRNNRTNNLNVGSGTLNCGSITFENATQTTRLARITISTGTLNVTGNITFGGTTAKNIIEFTNNGTLNIGGAFSSASGSNPGAELIATSGTINYNSNSAQVIYGGFIGKYFNLTLSGNATKTLNSGTSFELQNGSTLTVSSNTTLSLLGNTITCASGSANVIINGTVSTNNSNGLYGPSAAISSTNINTPTLAVNSNVIYNSSSIQTVSALNYDNLTLNSGSIKSLGGNVSINAALVNNTTELSIGNNTLTINGTASGSGTLTGSSTSNLTIGGSSSNITINMTQNSSNSRTINNLVMSRANGAVIGDTLEVLNTITVSNGNLNANGKLILVSNANNTARVSQISSGGIVGNVIAQRFIPGGSNKRKWRFLAFPVNNGSGGMPISEFIDDIHVTGTGASANGFDECGGCGASLRTYTESISGGSNNGWTNPASINAVIPTGTGFEVFVRGDRNTVQNPFNGASVPTDVTIDYTGIINSGNYTFNLSYTNTNDFGDGFNLVANPYPSQIDWQAATGWTRNNINIHAYVYNANTGSYGTVSTSGATTGDQNISRYIPSGQSFFVKANAANPSISMTESIKVSNTPFNFFKSSTNAEMGYVKFKVTSPNYEDNLVIRLDTNASDSAIDSDDAFKFFNDRLNFYTKSAENSNLSINHYPYPDSINIEDTINVSIFSFNDSSIEYSTHRIELIENVNLDGDIKFDLIDNYTNERIPISTLGWYNFNIDSNTSSVGNNRFDIVVYRIFTGIEQERIKKLVSLYPNPAVDQINFRTASQNLEEVKVSIFNLQGQLISEEFKIMNTENSYCNLSNISEGVYFLKIEGKSFNETHKFIKTK